MIEYTNKQTIVLLRKLTRVADNLQGLLTQHTLPLDFSLNVM